MMATGTDISTAAAGEEVRETWFNTLEKNLAEQTEIVQSVARRLGSVNDRLFGSVPSPVGKETADEAQPHCAMDATNRQLQRLQGQSAYLVTELERLEAAGLV